jgi:hypothetical protein
VALRARGPVVRRAPQASHPFPAYGEQRVTFEVKYTYSSSGGSTWCAELKLLVELAPNLAKPGPALSPLQRIYTGFPDRVPGSSSHTRRSMPALEAPRRALEVNLVALRQDTRAG